MIPSSIPTNTSQTYITSPIPGRTNQFHGTDHVHGPAAANYPKHLGIGNYNGQNQGHGNRNYSVTQDSGYQSLATTPNPTLCSVSNDNVPFGACRF